MNDDDLKVIGTCVICKKSIYENQIMSKTGPNTSYHWTCLHLEKIKRKEVNSGYIREHSVKHD